MSAKIASSFLAPDESQIEYYTEVTDNMVGRLLRDVELCSVIETKPYGLDGDALAAEQKQWLMELCRQRLETFMSARGSAIWIIGESLTASGAAL
jgi:hypothetical protein